MTFPFAPPLARIPSLARTLIPTRTREMGDDAGRATTP